MTDLPTPAGPDAAEPGATTSDGASTDADADADAAAAAAEGTEGTDTAIPSISESSEGADLSTPHLDEGTTETGTAEKA
jgi:hypothetical protein